MGSSKEVLSRALENHHQRAGAEGGEAAIEMGSADLLLVDGDHSFSSALGDLVMGCAALAPPSSSRELVVVMDDVGEGCHNQPLGDLYSANSCDATRAWAEAIAGGFLVELHRKDFVQDHRVSGLAVGRCILKPH